MNSKNISANKPSPHCRPAGKGWYGLVQTCNFQILPPPNNAVNNQQASQDTKATNRLGILQSR
jgi:hypothetical protein